MSFIKKIVNEKIQNVNFSRKFEKLIRNLGKNIQTDDLFLKIKNF